MSENCTHDCSTCSSACASRTAPQDLLEKPNDMTHVKKLIGVVSGKGGVGKSHGHLHAGRADEPSGLHTPPFWMRISPAPPSPRAFGLHEQCAGHR